MAVTMTKDVEDFLRMAQFLPTGTMNGIFRSKAVLKVSNLKMGCLYWVHVWDSENSFSRHYDWPLCIYTGMKSGKPTFRIEMVFGTLNYDGGRNVVLNKLTRGMVKVAA